MREAIKRTSRGHSRGAACRCAQDEARGRRDGARVLGCSPPLIWRAARSAPCRAPPSRASCQGAGPEAGGGRGAKGGERGGGGGFRARVRAHSNQGPSRANKGKSMAIHGNQSQSMASMAINGNQWQSMTNLWPKHRLARPQCLDKERHVRLGTERRLERRERALWRARDPAKHLLTLRN